MRVIKVRRRIIIRCRCDVGEEKERKNGGGGCDVADV